MSNPTIVYKVGLQFYRHNYHNEYNIALSNVISHHAARLHTTPDRTCTYDENTKYFGYLHINYFLFLAIKIAPSVWMLGMGLARNEAPSVVLLAFVHIYGYLQAQEHLQHDHTLYFTMYSFPQQSGPRKHRKNSNSRWKAVNCY